MVDAITNGLSKVIGTVFDKALTFLTQGAAKGCPRDMEEVDASQPFCRAVWPSEGRGMWTGVPSGEQSIGNIYYKPSQAAELRQIASGKNCPPGLFPFNGSCWSSCPPQFQRQEVPYTAADVAAQQEAARQAQAEGKAPPSVKKRFRCIAECEKDWHPLTWKEPHQLSYYNQDMQIVPTVCYHEYPLNGPALDNTNAFNDLLNIPHTLEIATIQVADDPSAAEPELSPNGDVVPKSSFEKRGIYAQRKRFALPPAVDPLPCTDPYQVTASGACVKPCAAGSKLYGDSCFQVSQKCPNGWNEDKTGAFCTPTVVDMPRYPSLINIIVLIAGIALAGVIIAKVTVSVVQKKASVAEGGVGGSLM